MFGDVFGGLASTASALHAGMMINADLHRRMADTYYKTKSQTWCNGEVYVHHECGKIHVTYEGYSNVPRVTRH